jgi:invasion protein IalB
MTKLLSVFLPFTAGVCSLFTLAGASVAQTQPAPAAQPQITKTETIPLGNWLLTCVDYANSAIKRACTAKLQIVQEKTNSPAFIWEIGLTGDRKIASVIHVPTGVIIDHGVELHVGKAAPRKIAFTACMSGECTAQFAVDEKFIKEVAANPTVEANILAVNGATPVFQINPAGIDKAFAQLGGESALRP